MAINNQSAIESIKTTLKDNGFNLGNTELTNVLIETLVNTILNEVKKADVTTTISGTCPNGVVSGTGTGKIL